MSEMKLINADCIEAMKAMEDNSIDSIVTDPPYELSNDGKASPNWVLFETVFPQNAKLDAIRNGEGNLALFVDKVLCLSGGRDVPTPSATVPVSAVTLNDEIQCGDINVIDGKESAVGISNNLAGFNIETEPIEHLGNFALKLADPTIFFNILAGIGSSFYAGGIGVGFGISPASFPSLDSGCASIPLGDDDIRFRNDSLTTLVSAVTRTGSDSVFSFDLTGGSKETFTANGARLFAAILLASGAELVRTTATASDLSAVLEAREICVVDDSTNGAFSFNLIIHPQTITSTGFMGKSWDGSKIAFNVAVWQEALRVLKPGGHLIAFSGSRTYHRMAVAIEDAGFEIRDQIMWVYGSGFPKSMNIEKAINKVDGVEFIEKPASGVGFMNAEGAGGYNTTIHQLEQVGDSSERAANWQGWGTALKPAHEPMVLARKPLIGTVANNVLTHGTGGLNIDGSRVATDDKWEATGKQSAPSQTLQGGVDGSLNVSVSTTHPEGRWPANFIHDGSDEVVGLFPSVKTGSIKPHQQNSESESFGLKGKFITGSHKGDSGSAARFFYCAKASKRDRNEGLDDSYAKQMDESRKAGSKGGNNPRNRGANERINHHPTVKPTSLMQYLVRLITPQGGVVLDPFMGSGSTGKACAYEGFDFIGIEQSAEYVEIARARIAYAQNESSEEVES